ncbi:unnamed protein product [Soboliphyme baturini]|uniref:Estradiol 17-beta-dehydrogenase 2 n=1 Tax=Soboliphyme baturini TaxID=241478 RepID=A0A183IVF6_9BILA|nr:unnamed protein product [Soboliphyme baturini]
MWFALLSLLVIAIFFVVDTFIRTLRHPRFDGRSVLVTGCDSGFGEELAIALSVKNIPTFASCLTEQGMKNLRSKIGVRSAVSVFQMDICDQRSVDNGYNFVKKTLTDKELWAVVNNAGVSGAEFYDDWMTVEDYKNVMEVNFFGTVRITQSFKPLIKKSRGRFVFMTSVLGRVAVPMTGPYCASKFALEAYCDIIRRELSPWGVGIYILEPGFFCTALTDPRRKQHQWKQRVKALDESILDEYDENFITQGYKGQEFLLESFCCKNTSLVVEAYMNAITARFPKYRCFIGLNSKIIMLPFAYFPSFISDLATFVIYGFSFGRVKRKIDKQIELNKRD